MAALPGRVARSSARRRGDGRRPGSRHGDRGRPRSGGGRWPGAPRACRSPVVAHGRSAGRRRSRRCGRRGAAHGKVARSPAPRASRGVDPARRPSVRPRRAAGLLVDVAAEDERLVHARPASLARIAGLARPLGRRRWTGGCRPPRTSLRPPSSAPTRRRACAGPASAGTAGTRSRARRPAGRSAAGCPAPAGRRPRTPARTRRARSAHLDRHRNRRGRLLDDDHVGRRDRTTAASAARSSRSRVTLYDITRRSRATLIAPPYRIGGPGRPRPPRRPCCPSAPRTHLGDRQPAARGQLLDEGLAGPAPSAGRPASITPPPITSTCGSTTWTMSASPLPSHCPTSANAASDADVAGLGGPGHHRAVIASSAPPARSSRMLGAGRVRRRPHSRAKRTRALAAGVLLQAAQPAAAARLPAAARRGRGPSRRRCRCAPRISSPAEHDAAADAGADGEQHHRVVGVPGRAEPELGPGGHVGVVLHA